MPNSPARITRASDRRGFATRRRVALVAAAAWLAMGSAASAGDDYDRWYTLDLAGRRAGWAHASQRTDGRGVTTSLVQRLRLQRAADVLELSSESQFVETLSGKPVSMRLTQTLGAAPITFDFVFSETGIDATTHSQPGVPPRHETWPLDPAGGTWLTPAAAATFVQQRLGAGAKELTLRTPFIDRGPLPLSLELRRGTPVEGFQMSTALVPMPMFESEARSIVDERGVLIEGDVQVAGLRLRSRLSDKATCELPFDAPDFTSIMIVKPDQPLHGARKLTAADFTITLRSSPPATDAAANAPPITVGDHTMLFPATSMQTVERTADGSIRVRINVAGDAPASADDASDARYSDASVMIDPNDADVMMVSRQAVNGIGTRPLAEQAEAMRKFVRRYISGQSLSVGLGTSSEVVRTKAGDCTEHAVLLAAMLRASGIPSRVMVGLVYADTFAAHKDVFVFHMWTQALIETDDGGHRWLDLDATSDTGTPIDATHIALFPSALENAGALRAIDAALGVLEGMQIRIGENR